MVNLTYGLLNVAAPTDPASASILPGSDVIAVTEDGSTIAAYNPGDMAWILTCTALVFIMIPGLGYLYSGLVRRKNALHMLLATMLCLAVVSFEWWFWGYSLAFSDSENGHQLIGDLKYFGFMHVLEAPVAAASNRLPAIVFAIYEQQFAALVPAIAIGAACERGRIWPVIPFTFFWTTICYNVLAYSVWNPQGWAYKLGVLDYAGGGPVEIASGVTGLVYSLYLGRRRGWGTDRLQYAPHSVAHVFLGTVLLWFGWLGFNGGSTFAANLKAGMAITGTNIAACFGGLTWMLLDWRHFYRWSVVGFCTGAISGLVAITPAAGFVGVPAAALIGVVAAAVSNWLTRLKIWFNFDDTLDIFSCHGISGIVGLLMTGIFCQSSVAANDGYAAIAGGWLDGNWIQFAYQLAWVSFATAWTAITTYAIMFIIDHIPYCHFRTDADGEMCGLDEVECGEVSGTCLALQR
ncbi:ammonium transporter [Cystobasidium minutum MCA 4210]|uniref:ammonium transporter n=1 Tax=Cystobasidium minutum MCA 4210 TaxID=1397322 RepID=UPI0034CF7A60|eukprot:jgi/Rhomi1/167308/fgenesh1_kg.2_\